MRETLKQIDPGHSVMRSRLVRTTATLALSGTLLLGSWGCSPGAPAGDQTDVTFPTGWPFPADVPAVEAEHGIVSSTDEYASQVGVDILQAGGNAVDAAIATAFALAVVNPEAGNIGGGGFMVIRLADGSTAALDFREKAPLAATRNMFLDEEGNLTDRSVVGHLAAGVPGSVRGLWEAHRRFGAVPWATLVDPAIRLAEGYVVRERQARSFESNREGLALFQTTAEIFLPGGVPAVVGDTFQQPDLARTLRRIRDEGADGFYRGETADLIVAEMTRGGGLIAHRDLEEYTAAWRTPIEFGYRGHTVISMPPSSSGGATLAEMAQILEQYDLASLGWHSPEMIFLQAEASKRAYSDRNQYLADPEFVEMPLEEMISPEYARERAADISLERATPSTEIGPGLGSVDRGEHTTHLSVVDAHRNAVSLTTTINSWFGNKVTVAGAGFLLNNEMDDFAAKPGSPNQFGLVQGESNAIQGGKRMLSAMTPSIVVDPQGRLRMVTGTPGGATIITTVFQTISNVLDFGMDVVHAVRAPRVHHQHLPDLIHHEPHGLTPEVISALEGLGQTVTEREVIGDVQAILVLEDGTLAAASDPRRGGTAVGY